MAVRNASAIRSPRSYSLNSPISDEEFAEMMKQIQMDPVGECGQGNGLESIEKAHRGTLRWAGQYGAFVPDESLDKTISLGSSDRRSWVSRGHVVVSNVI